MLLKDKISENLIEIKKSVDIMWNCLINKLMTKFKQMAVCAVYSAYFT